VVEPKSPPDRQIKWIDIEAKSGDSPSLVAKALLGTFDQGERLIDFRAAGHCLFLH
jgi:hypothetical protein